MKKNTLKPKLKKKQKLGKIERVHDEQTLIVKDLFKKETNVDLFERLKVTLSNGETGMNFVSLC